MSVSPTAGTAATNSSLLHHWHHYLNGNGIMAMWEGSFGRRKEGKEVEGREEGRTPINTLIHFHPP